MKIDLTKKQYKSIIKAFEISSSIYGILSDTTNKKYQKQYQEIEDLERYFLEVAPIFGAGEILEKNNDRFDIKESLFEKYQAVISEYDDYAVYSGLSNKLAWRNFRREHSKAEIEKMAKNNMGYFGVEICPYEEIYWNEFDEHGFERLEIVSPLID